LSSCWSNDGRSAQPDWKQSDPEHLKTTSLLIAGVGILLSAVDLAAAAPARPENSPRAVLDWDAGWRFSQGEFAAAMSPAFDDHGWRTVRVPHDWSTEEPFSADYGSGNGYAAGGVGWYRKHFQLDPAWQGRAITVEFDGVYDYAEVWINGQYVGGRPYGYSSFQCDVTPFVTLGADDNVLAVRVDHSRFADSRWYTGSGIYRNVRLVVTDQLRIAHWGTFVSMPSVAPDAATVRIETTVQNASDRSRAFTVQSDLFGADGQVVATATDATGSADAGAATTVVQTVVLAHPHLWSPDTPALYTLRCRVGEGAIVIDETLTPFGVRTLRYDPDTGFALNGTPMKLKGVCLHHDAGPLGAAVPAAVWERRLRALKEIGVNAIRTSHNPPAPEFLDLCDRMGLLVMDEAFDEFTPTKKKWVEGWNQGQPGRFGYGEIFAEWGVRDVQDMVRRDRNHPSVILWSIGNEVDYPNDPFSHPVLGDRYQPANPRVENLVTCAEPLVAAVKALDRTRPVTAALASIVMSNAVGLPEKLDVVGYNYQEADYAADHAKYPRRVIFGSENSHSYAAWAAVRDNAYVGGQFLWTGIDYLGEAGRWPNRANGAGLLDLCGFKKPMAWFRQSLWSDQPMVYLCVPGEAANRRATAAEHWNWPVGMTVAVACYTNCAEVELTLNERSLGVKPATAAVDGVLTWQIPYEAGALKAVGRNGGREVCSFTLKTAEAASRIELRPDTRQLTADGRDICHLEFQIVDANGVRVSDAGPEITFDVSGPAVLLGIGNGDLNSTESCREPTHRVFCGRGLAILQTTEDAGDITIRATAPGLKSAVLTIDSRK
jgi:beta-galactosidase